jgi:hypothetical protein
MPIQHFGRALTNSNRAALISHSPTLARNWPQRAFPWLVRAAAFFERTVMHCRLHLRCVFDPFDVFAIGEIVSDPAEVKRLAKDRHHFERIWSTYNETTPTSAEAAQ